MGLYDQITEGLKGAANRLGGKADLMRHLDAKKATLYRAMDDEKPCLPNPDVLCQWLDKLHARVIFPDEEMDGFVLIPRVRATAGAGESWETEDDVAGMYAFRQNFMEYLHVKPQHAVMMFVRGDSMEPLINDRDMILIDTNDTEPREGYPYVLQYGGTLMVKRLQRTLHGWNICSENRNYPPIPVEGQEMEALKVIGRVRWFGRVVE